MALKIYNTIQWIFMGIGFLLILTLAVLFFGMHIKPCIIMSESMEPTIMTGSICFIDEDVGMYEVGDIVTYDKDDKSIIHRIVEITDEGYITKGDNNDVVDPGIRAENDITGTFVYTIPKIGNVVLLVQNPVGLIAILAGLAFFVLIGVLLRSMRF